MDRRKSANTLPPVTAPSRYMAAIRKASGVWTLVRRKDTATTWKFCAAKIMVAVANKMITARWTHRIVGSHGVTTATISTAHQIYRPTPRVVAKFHLAPQHAHLSLMSGGSGRG